MGEIAESGGDSVGERLLSLKPEPGRSGGVGGSTIRDPFMIFRSVDCSGARGSEDSRNRSIHHVSENFYTAFYGEWLPLI